MFKEFQFHIAWTDTMQEGHKFVGLIEFQQKQPGAITQVLWVIPPNVIGEHAAEQAAMTMLREIHEITFCGDIIFSDGIAL